MNTVLGSRRERLPYPGSSTVSSPWTNPTKYSRPSKSGATLPRKTNSTDLEDMFIAHIGGMDTFARGLVIADKVNSDPRMLELRYGRYASFDVGNGKRFENGVLGLEDLRDLAAENGEPVQTSAKHELVENLINDHIIGAC